MVTVKVYEGYISNDTTCKLIVRGRRPCLLCFPTHFSLLTSWEKIKCSRSLHSDIFTRCKIVLIGHIAYVKKTAFKLSVESILQIMKNL